MAVMPGVNTSTIMLKPRFLALRMYGSSVLTLVGAFGP